MQPASTKNKIESAATFLKLCASGNVEEAYATYASHTFRHHNPYFHGDADSLKRGMAEAHTKFPDTTLDVQHTFQDGELVAVHSRVRHSSDTPEIAVVHIFRFEGEKIVEMWDVGQEVPADSPNENGAF